MAQSNYRDLVVWQKARVLTRDIYLLTRRFPREELFGITQQMRNAALSIPSNIAEGCGRRTRPDFCHFLMMARGSTFELETQCIIASDVGYLEESTTNELTARTAEIAKMLNGLLRYVSRPSR